jgi:hypothetical protein
MKRLHPLIRVIAIGVPVAGAIPTGLNLYHSFKHGIRYAQVSHKLEQYDLWVRNMNCPIEYKELNANLDARINIGVCATSGDISIKVAMPEGKAIIEWIALDRLKQANALLNFLLSPAYAEATAPGLLNMRVAQAASQVACQAWEGSGKIVRIVKEGGRCFRETISAYQGYVDKRTEVSCNRSCPPTKAN